MKKIAALIILISIISGCLKSNDSKPCMPASPASEAPQLTDFCNTNGIAYTKDSNGIFYQIIDPGSGITPSLESEISVTYTSSFLNDYILDSRTTMPVTNLLSEFIEGWQLAIPYIQKGGHIKMVLPSSLCFGCSGTPSVPPNSPLYYDLVLVDVQ
ncbi:MAG: FKBP-type peptidyl-prolyl cis-trans isomerase [Parafilimonas sp.]